MNTSAIQLSIAEVTHLLTTDFDSLRVLETIVERSRQDLSGVWCVLVVRNGEPDYLDVLVESADADFIPDRTLAIAGPAALSAESGAVVMIDNFADVGERWQKFGRSGLERGLGGCRCFPMRLGRKSFGTLVVFTRDSWDSATRSNAYGQSMADLAALTLSTDSRQDRHSHVAVAVKKLITVRGEVEQAVGMIAELEGLSIELATARLEENARRRGISAGAYSALVLANPDNR